MKLKEHLIAKHGVIWVQRRDSFGQPFNDGVDTNSEELSPISNGALWVSTGRECPEGEEIDDQDLAKMVTEYVKNGRPMTPDVLSTLELPAIPREGYLHHGDFFYRPAPPSQSGYPHHVYYIAKTMDAEAPPSAVYKALGTLSKDSDIDYVRFNQSYGFYIHRQCVTDLGRESLPLLPAHVLPDTKVDLLPALPDIYDDTLTSITQKGVLWVKDRTLAGEEMVPKLDHSLTSPLERNQILDKLVEEQQLVIYTKHHSLLLPKCTMCPQQNEWFDKIAFGISINSSALSTLTPLALERVWKILMSKSQTQGFMLLLIKSSPVGETKFDKLTRSLDLLSDREYANFSHTGCPTFQSLTVEEHPKLFLGPCLTQTIRAQGPMVEIISAILTERGETILLIVGKTDSSGTLHTPVNTYGLSSPKHWKGLSTPLDVTTSLDQRTTAILQDVTRG
jgi:hypothetical protein